MIKLVNSSNISMNDIYILERIALFYSSNIYICNDIHVEHDENIQ